jgi:cyclic pyranopterin phosphate synthase
MPPQGIEWKARAQILSFEEIVRVARLFVEMGVDKIRLTGGEPTIRHNITRLVEQLAALPGLKTIAMTTNGVLLMEKARALKSAGLTRLNVSLDTLRKERFEKITLRTKFDHVMAGIEAALDAGFQPLKLNVVAMKDFNDDELLDFVEFVRNRPINVRFIEFMPFKGNGWKPTGIVPFADMKRTIEERYSLLPLETSAAVAKDFSIKGFAGTVSFISPMTAEFCEFCTRLRLIADGSIKSCLLFPSEVNLRDALRDGTDDCELVEMIRNAVQLKMEGHSAMAELTTMDNRHMVEMGG